jgi:hypothetical protein
MGNKICFCCIKDDAIAKPGNQLESLIRSKNGINMMMSDCSFCGKKNVACFQNYGSLGERIINVCVCCDIDLETNILGY